MKLSIIIPVYNEEKTIEQVLEKIVALQLSTVKKEIIVIDDGSTDRTTSIISKFSSKKSSLFKEAKLPISNFKYIKHKKNMGKGAAVKTGIQQATGEYIIIQDADLEYHPNEIPILVNKIQKGKVDVVYGTRLNRLPNFRKDERRLRFFVHYLGNKFLSLLTSVLYGQWITDMETCYKLFPQIALNGITIHARGFEFEPEITAKLLKKGYHITEVPISTNPRGYEEGKKLNTIRDGIKAVKTLLKYRFSN